MTGENSSLEVVRFREAERLSHALYGLIIVTAALARAMRRVALFSPTSTIREAPCSSKWVSSAIPNSSQFFPQLSNNLDIGGREKAIDLFAEL